MDGAPSLRLLGPLEVRLDQGKVPVRAGKHRALLAALALRAGKVVSIGELVLFLWGDDPPARTRGTLQTYVMRLRQLLGDPSLIRTTSDGYRLLVPPEQVDVHRFASTAALAKQAARSGDLAGAAELYGRALDLWRGPALADVPSAVLRDREAARLVERLMAVHEERNDVELALGNHERLIPLLRGLAADHPLDRFPAQLMLALYRASRQAEALETFRLLRNPGPELRELHQTWRRRGTTWRRAWRCGARPALRARARPASCAAWACWPWRPALRQSLPSPTRPRKRELRNGTTAGQPRTQSAREHARLGCPSGTLRNGTTPSKGPRGTPNVPPKSTHAQSRRTHVLDRSPQAHTPSRRQAHAGLRPRRESAARCNRWSRRWQARQRGRRPQERRRAGDALGTPHGAGAGTSTVPPDQAYVIARPSERPSAPTEPRGVAEGIRNRPR